MGSESSHQNRWQLTKPSGTKICQTNLHSLRFGGISFKGDFLNSSKWNICFLQTWPDLRRTPILTPSRLGETFGPHRRKSLNFEGEKFHRMTNTEGQHWNWCCCLSQKTGWCHIWHHFYNKQHKTKWYHNIWHHI